jgi:hypothetical protein
MGRQLCQYSFQKFPPHTGIKQSNPVMEPTQSEFFKYLFALLTACQIAWYTSVEIEPLCASPIPGASIPQEDNHSHGRNP